MVRILCTGDMHLGRYPSRIEPGIDELRVDAVWRRFVQTAIDREVDVVVLTGDTVDRENKLFEAMRPLEQGIVRLAENGIEIVAVAGNHDYDVFPRLVDNLGETPLHFLGAGGRWQTRLLHRDGSPMVRFVGWSFPQRYVHESPLANLSPDSPGSPQWQTAAEVPTIGVLHCDRDQPGSPYAPVESRQLGRAPVDAWLLGHVHEHDIRRDGSQLQLYPGSLQPLHPNEGGVHGGWLVEVHPDGEASAELLSLASLMYAEVSVDVEDCEDVDVVESRSFETVRKALDDAVRQVPHLRRAVYRLNFEGRTSLGSDLEARAPEVVDGFETGFEDASATIDDISLRLRPVHDLERLAESNNTPGVLARLLLDLKDGNAATENGVVNAENGHAPVKDGGDVAARVLSEAERSIAEVQGQTGYEYLHRTTSTKDLPDEEAVKAMIKRRGMLLLDELLEGASDHA